MAKKRKQRVNWVVMGPDPHFATCRRCGEWIAAPPLPMRVEAFVKYGEYIQELHRHCKETPEVPVTETPRSLAED